MSAILESLLTPQQRAEAEAADRAEKARVLAHLTQQVRDLNELHFCELFNNDSEPVQQAVTEAFGCTDVVADWLYGECDGHDGDHITAERVMRAPGRYPTADVSVVFCAALMSAHRGDGEECLRAMRQLAARFVGAREQRIGVRSDVIAAELRGDAE